MLTWLAYIGGNGGYFDQTTRDFEDSSGNHVAFQGQDTAVFSTSAPGVQTVYVDANTQFSGMVFQGGTWKIASTNGSELEMYNPSYNGNTIEVDHSEQVNQYTVVNDTISAAIIPSLGQNDSGLDIVGTITGSNESTGDVLLNNPYNQFPGGITLSGGALTINNAGELGSGTITVAAGNSQYKTAALVFQGGFNVSNQIVLQNGTLRIDTQGNDDELSGSISVPSGDSGTIQVNDTIGNGILDVTDNNSNLSTTVYITSGTLQLGNPNALGSTTSTMSYTPSTVIVDGGVFDLGGYIYEPAGSFTFTSGDISDGTLALDATFTADIGSSNPALIDGIISASHHRRHRKHGRARRQRAREPLPPGR